MVQTQENNANRRIPATLRRMSGAAVFAVLCGIGIIISLIVLSSAPPDSSERSRSITIVCVLAFLLMLSIRLFVSTRQIIGPAELSMLPLECFVQASALDSTKVQFEINV